VTVIQWVGNVACLLCMAVAGLAVRHGLFASNARDLAELDELKRLQARVDSEAPRLWTSDEAGRFGVADSGR